MAFKNKNNRGFVLPVAVFILALLELIGIGLLIGMSHTKRMETQINKMENSKHGIPNSVMDKYAYDLIRPDDGTQAYTFSDGSTSNQTFVLDGKTVTATRTDKKVKL
jgi:hypothetical protein